MLALPCGGEIAMPCQLGAFWAILALPGALQVAAGGQRWQVCGVIVVTGGHCPASWPVNAPSAPTSLTIMAIVVRVGRRIAHRSPTIDRRTSDSRLFLPAQYNNPFRGQARGDPRLSSATRYLPHSSDSPYPYHTATMFCIFCPPTHCTMLRPCSPTCTPYPCPMPTTLRP